MIESLHNLPLFQGLVTAQIALFDPLFDSFACPTDHVIFKQDEQAEFFYILLKGTVAIHFKPYDGPAITIVHLQRGDAFGWSAVVGSEHYTSGCFSTSEVEAARIRGSALRKLVLENPESGRIFLQKLANVVSSRWQNATAEVQALFDKPAQGPQRPGQLAEIRRQPGSD